MTRSTVALGAGLVLVAALTGWLLLGSRGERLAIDLIDELPNMTQVPGQQEVAELTLAGEPRRALLVGDYGRYIYKLTVPNRAWLRLSIGHAPEASTTEGDGVLFIVGAWDAEVWDELLNYVVDPFHTPEDRGWHDVALDLSKYAGQTIELRFVLRQRDTATGDRPAWGDPRIVIR